MGLLRMMMSRGRGRRHRIILSVCLLILFFMSWGQWLQKNIPSAKMLIISVGGGGGDSSSDTRFLNRTTTGCNNNKTNNNERKQNDNTTTTITNTTTTNTTNTTSDSLLLLLQKGPQNIQCSKVPSNVSQTWNYNMKSPMESLHEEHAVSSSITTTTTTNKIPRNLHLAFIGDSVSRYIYLSLVHYLRFGIYPNENEIPSFVWEKHYDSWNIFFNYSNYALRPMEQCDCTRLNLGQAIENRYFYDPIHNNSIIYITKSGKLNFKSYNNPSQITFTTTPLLKKYPGKNQISYQGDWIKALNFVSQMKIPPKIIIFNAGLWPHDLDNVAYQNEIIQTLKQHNMIGIYRTTTAKKFYNNQWKKQQHLNNLLLKKHNHNNNNKTNHHRYDDDYDDDDYDYDRIPLDDYEQQLCSKMKYCLDARWTYGIRSCHYADRNHFHAPIYKQLNLQLLDIVKRIMMEQQKEEEQDQQQQKQQGNYSESDECQ